VIKSYQFTYPKPLASGSTFWAAFLQNKHVGNWYFTYSVKIPVFGTQVDVQMTWKVGLA